MQKKRKIKIDNVKSLLLKKFHFSGELFLAGFLKFMIIFLKKFINTSSSPL